jgi:hypothetical protein
MIQSIEIIKLCTKCGALYALSHQGNHNRVARRLAVTRKNCGAKLWIFYHRPRNRR